MAKKGKRANNEGTIYKKTKTVNGKTYESWEAQLTVGYKADGTPKRKSVSGKTQADVVAKINELKHTIATGDYMEPSKLTLKEWAELWLDDYCVDVKYRTREEYRRTLNNHVLPALGNAKIDKLTGADIQHLCNNLKNHRADKPLSPKTIKDVHTVLHSCLETAFRNEFIRRNPCDRTRLPKVKQKEIVPLNEQDIAVFLDMIVGHKYETLFIVALFTGMRESEICGLTWDCINFKTHEITVKQQLQKQNGQYLLVATKTDRVGTITVADSVIKLLEDLRKEQLSKDADTWDNTLNLVFTNENGRYCIPHVVYENFKRVAEKMGMPEARFHDLRHSCATALLANGVDIKTVQMTLRHASATTTQRYVHCTDDMMKTGADKMESLFKRTRTA